MAGLLLLSSSFTREEMVRGENIPAPGEGLSNVIIWRAAA